MPSEDPTFTLILDYFHNGVAILTTKQPFRCDSPVSPICLIDRNSPHLQDNEELIVIGGVVILVNLVLLYSLVVFNNSK